MCLIDQLKLPTKVSYQGDSGYAVRVGDTKVRIDWGEDFVVTYDITRDEDRILIEKLKIIRREE